MTPKSQYTFILQITYEFINVFLNYNELFYITLK